MKGITNSTIYKYIHNINSLPSQYQCVEYIQSDGKSYIDTGVRSHSNMSCEMQFEFLEIPKDGTVLGARKTIQQEGSGKNRLYFYHYYQGHKLGYGMYLGRGTAEINTPYNIKTRLDVGHQYMHINHVLAFEGFDDYYIDNDINFHMFALNPNSDANNVDVQYYTKIKMYYCKIWDGEELVRYFIPSYDTDTGEIGLYDLIKCHFYTNDGEGQFAKGPDTDVVISKNIMV